MRSSFLSGYSFLIVDACPKGRNFEISDTFWLSGVVELKARQQRHEISERGWKFNKAEMKAVRLSGPMLQSAFDSGIDHKNGTMNHFDV